MLPCKTVWCWIILLNRFLWELFTFKMLLMKVVLLIKYSEKKIIFRKIQLNFGLNNWLWKVKMSNFCQSSIKMPYKISKNPFRRLIQLQISIDFQLHHWEIPQLSPYYPTVLKIHAFEFLFSKSTVFSGCKKLTGLQIYEFIVVR